VIGEGGQKGRDLAAREHFSLTSGQRARILRDGPLSIKEPTMPESNRPATDAAQTTTQDERPPSDGAFLVLEGALGLDVLEGLAEADGGPERALLEPLPVPPAAHPRTPGQPSLHEALAALGEDLGVRIDALKSTFERELRGEASRERIVDRLHAELQDFIDLIQLHDDVGKMAVARAAADSEAPGTTSFRVLMEAIQTAIEDILYRQGVEPFSLETDEFDPRRQRAISTSPTEDPTQSKKVAARIRKGFAAGDKLIRPELVSVFTLRQSAADRDA
jgi:molecular chaperone GrpE